MRNNHDRDFLASIFFFKQVGDGARYVRAERFESLAFDAQAVDVGMFDELNACFVIVRGFNDGNAHRSAPTVFSPG